MTTVTVKEAVVTAVAEAVVVVVVVVVVVIIITFMNKKTNNTFLMDIAVPNIYNLAKTITNKQNNYQELANEICAMW